jgi:hypothetical protein
MPVVQTRRVGEIHFTSEGGGGGGVIFLFLVSTDFFTKRQGDGGLRAVNLILCMNTPV